jgi:hypothetical protein
VGHAPDSQHWQQQLDEGAARAVQPVGAWAQLGRPLWMTDITEHPSREG